MAKHDLLQIAGNISLAVQLKFEKQPGVLESWGGDDRYIEIETPAMPPPNADPYLIVRFKKRG